MFFINLLLAGAYRERLDWRNAYREVCRRKFCRLAALLLRSRRILRESRLVSNRSHRAGTADSNRSAFPRDYNRPRMNFACEKLSPLKCQTFVVTDKKRRSSVHRDLGVDSVSMDPLPAITVSCNKKIDAQSSSICMYKSHYN